MSNFEIMEGLTITEINLKKYAVLTAQQVFQNITMIKKTLIH